MNLRQLGAKLTPHILQLIHAFKQTSLPFLHYFNPLNRRLQSIVNLVFLRHPIQPFIHCGHVHVFAERDDFLVPGEQHGRTLRFNGLALIIDHYSEGVEWAGIFVIIRKGPFEDFAVKLTF